LLMPLILGTLVTVHGKNGWLFGNKGGAWEYPAFCCFAVDACLRNPQMTATGRSLTIRA